VLTDIHALADHFLMALPNINSVEVAKEAIGSMPVPMKEGMEVPKEARKI